MFSSSPLLKSVIREQFKSSCFIQSDCCDSITSIYNQHHYASSLEDAVVLAVNAGLYLSHKLVRYVSEDLSGTQLSYSFPAAHEKIRVAFAAALSAGKLQESQLDAAVERILLTRFRLGEFDPVNPFSQANESKLDCPSHR